METGAYIYGGEQADSFHFLLIQFFFCLVCYSLFDVTHNSLMAVYKYPLTWSIIPCLKHRLSSHSACSFFMHSIVEPIPW